MLKIKVFLGYHGGSGPMKVSGSLDDAGEAFIRAGEELGYPQVDTNGPDQIGNASFNQTCLVQAH